MKNEKLIYASDLLETVVAAAVKELIDADEMTLRALATRIKIVKSIKQAIADAPAADAVPRWQYDEMRASRDRLEDALAGKAVR